MYAFKNDLSFNTFYLLSDEERMRLSDKIEQMERDINAKLKEGYFTVAKTKKGTLRNTTKSIYEICGKDIEAIDFLKKLCWFGQFDNSIALDPTKHQIKTIVDKLLFKVYRKEFIHWMELYLSNEDVSSSDMTEWMDRKRQIYYTLRNEGLISESLKLNY